MKLKIYRQSGSPVAPEHQDAYTEAYRITYDRCEAKADKLFLKKSGHLTLVPHMIMLQRYLRFAERGLMKKFSGNDEVELPRTAKAWTALISKFGDTPLMLAKEQNTGKLVLLLMDNLS